MMHFMPWKVFQAKEEEEKPKPTHSRLFEVQCIILGLCYVFLPWRWALFIHCYCGLALLMILGFRYPTWMNVIVRGHAMVIEPVTFTLGFAWGILLPFDPPWYAYGISLIVGIFGFPMAWGGIASFRAWSGWERLARGWLQYELIGDLPDGPCIYAVYPHGVATIGTLLTFAAHGGRLPLHLRRLGIATTPPMLNLPYVGPLLQAGGGSPVYTRILRGLDRSARTIDCGFTRRAPRHALGWARSHSD